MSFDITNHHIHPFIFALVGGFQHGIGLTHSGGIAEEDFQLAAVIPLLFGLDPGRIVSGSGREGS